MPRESRDTRKTTTRLMRDGWLKRQGKGYHANFYKPGLPTLITLDMGKKEIDKNIYRAIKRIAGWD